MSSVRREKLRSSISVFQTSELSDLYLYLNKLLQDETRLHPYKKRGFCSWLRIGQVLGNTVGVMVVINIELYLIGITLFVEINLIIIIKRRVLVFLFHIFQLVYFICYL